MALDLSGLSNRLITQLSGDKTTTGHYQYECETGGTEDPNTGDWIPGTKVTETIDATETKLDESLIDGINIKSGDRLLLVRPAETIPDGAYFLVRGRRHSIVGEMPIWNGGVLQLQRFVIRSS